MPSGSVYISSPDDNEHDQCACGHLTPSRCRIGVNEYEGCSSGVGATLPTLCVPFVGLVFVVQMILYLNTIHVEIDVQAGSRRLRRGVNRSRRRLRGPADTFCPF